MRSVAVALAIVFVALASAAHAAPPTGKVPLPCEPRLIDLLPHGERMVVNCGDTYRLVEVPSGKQIASWKRAAQHAVTWSADGSTVAIAEVGTVRVYRARDGRLVAQLPAAPRYLVMLELSSDGKLVARGAVGQPAEVWSVAPTPKRVAALAGEFGTSPAAAFSADGARFAIAFDDTSVAVYDTASWKVVSALRDRALLTLSLAWSDDGKRLAFGGAGGVITVIDPATGSVVKTFPRRGDQVARLGFVGDRLFAQHLLQAGRGVELVWWKLDGSATPIEIEERPIGGGLVDGALWLVRATAEGAEIFTP